MFDHRFVIGLCYSQNSIVLCKVLIIVVKVVI
jgi:hypothetical protein